MTGPCFKRNCAFSSLDLTICISLLQHMAVHLQHPGNSHDPHTSSPPPPPLRCSAVPQVADLALLARGEALPPLGP